MDTNHGLQHDGGTPHELGETPITLRLPAGSALFVVRGEAWITHEGVAEDIVLGPGERFDVPNRRPLVVSATRGQVQVFAVPPAVARRHPERDLHAFARSRAAELRAASHRDAAATIAHAIRLGVARVRATLAPRSRLPTH
jgi:hypothetical protein